MTADGQNYLVVGLCGIARLDLVDAIRSAVKGAEIRVAPSLSEASELLRDGMRIVCAYVNAGVTEFEQCAIAQPLTQSGARIVLMGRDAESAATDERFLVLQRPYGAEDILATLEISGRNTQSVKVGL